jgi:competence ComEA-like helix-hairpin-helix protein
MLYSPTHLRLLLVIAAVVLVGAGVQEWRAGFPDPAARLEGFDRAEPPPLPPPPERPWPPAQSRPAQAMAAPRSGEPKALDLNRATADELARLPGVGQGLAQRIVEERQRRGRFESPDELRHVLGMGPKKLTALRALVTVGE